MFRIGVIALTIAATAVINGCTRMSSLWPIFGNQYPSLPTTERYGSKISNPEKYRYLIAPGDQLQIFVWRNPEVSQTVTVRPDGIVSTPLVDDLMASGKTPEQLARDIEKVISTYIREPIVTVIVAGGGVGLYSEQIRVVGAAAKPRALLYSSNMTLLDVMIQVEGVTEFAAGNKATILRVVDDKPTQFQVRLDDLLKDGDVTANVDMLPGDILIIPESWF